MLDWLEGHPVFVDLVTWTLGAAAACGAIALTLWNHFRDALKSAAECKAELDQLKANREKDLNELNARVRAEMSRDAEKEVAELEARLVGIARDLPRIATDGERAVRDFELEMEHKVESRAWVKAQSMEKKPHKDAAAKVARSEIELELERLKRNYTDQAQNLELEKGRIQARIELLNGEILKRPKPPAVA